MEPELLFWPAKNGKFKFYPAVFSHSRKITIKKKKVGNFYAVWEKSSGALYFWMISEPTLLSSSILLSSKRVWTRLGLLVPEVQHVSVCVSRTEPQFK